MNLHRSWVDSAEDPSWAEWYYRRRIANLPCNVKGCPCGKLNNGYLAHQQFASARRPWWFAWWPWAWKGGKS
jgi:hypothetical protein